MKQTLPLYVLLAGVVAPTTLFGAQRSKPNVVLILADDMGYSDISCYGGEIDTPNINSLAEQGVRFTQFYNASRSYPTRASLMTGLYQHQAGIGQMSEDPDKNGMWAHDWGTDGYKGYLNHNCVTIAEVLRENGYATYMTGKWHLGVFGEEKWPLQRGFDRFYGTLAGATSYFKPSGGRGLTLDNQKLEAPDAPYYTTDAFTDYAIEFIDQTKDRDPFFLYLAYNAPHWPLHAKESDIDKYRTLYREKGWDVVRQDRLERMVELGIIDKNCGLADWESRKWSELTPTEQEQIGYRMAVYAAQVDCMDQNIGRLIDHLKERGDYENTIFMFLSDNGACAEPYKELGGGAMKDINNAEKYLYPSYGLAWAQVSNTPFRRYKTRSFEGGVATPLVVSWAEGFGNRKGALRTVPSFLPDIMATIVDVTGSTYPEKYHDGNDIHPMVGKSLANAVRSDKIKSLHEYIFWEHQDNQAVRWGDWKAVKEQSTQKWELFNIVEDRAERVDIAEENPQTLKTMVAEWNKWAADHQVLPKRNQQYINSIKPQKDE